MSFQTEIYRLALRLIEEHGDAAEIAAVLFADPLPRDDRVRELVLQAIGELRAAALGRPS